MGRGRAGGRAGGWVGGGGVSVYRWIPFQEVKFIEKGERYCSTGLQKLEHYNFDVEHQRELQPTSKVWYLESMSTCAFYCTVAYFTPH